MVAPNPLFLRDAELDRALELLFLAERELHGRAGAALSRHALSGADYRALYVLGRRPGLTPASLARLLGVSRQAVSRHLQRLAELGYVRREADPEDRRKITVRLTDFARGQVDEAVALQRRHLRAAFKKAGAEAVEGFGRVLGELLGDGRPSAAVRVTAAP
jgi:DNA-binding MarR family transcriptional regulator